MVDPILRGRQPTHHCPACKAELPRPLAYGILADVEAGRPTRPRMARCCGETVKGLILRTYRTRHGLP